MANKQPKTAAGQVRRKLREYVKEKDVEKIVKNAIVMAKDGDKKMVTFVVEQLFGKATGTNVLKGGEPGDQPIQMTLTQLFDSLEK